MHIEKIFDKYIFIVIVLLLIGINLSQVSAINPQNSETSLFLSPSNTNVNPGDDVEFNLTIKDVVDLYGFQLNMDYDPNILNFTGISEEDFLKSDGKPTFVWNPDVSIPGIIKNYIIIRLGNVTGISGEGILAKVKFKAKNPGISKIGIFRSKLVDPNAVEIPHTTQNASVNIISNISLQVSPTNLIFGSLDPRQNSSIQKITLMPGNSDLTVSVSVTPGLFENIWLDITGNYNIVGSENIALSANNQKNISSILSIPVGYHSGNYTGIITYTAMTS